MPNIIVVSNIRMTFTEPFVNLFMSVSNHHFNSHSMVFEKFKGTMQTLFFHVIAPPYFITLQQILFASIMTYGIYPLPVQAGTQPFCCMLVQ